jgi:predicted peptidase
MLQQVCSFETKITRTIRLPYLLHLPPGYGKNRRRKWPLILFLHGAGQRGYEVEEIKKHGIPKIVEQQADFPFITVSPQCPPEVWWVTKLEALNTLLDEVIAAYAVDTNRLYLTGLSMGGYGAWHLAAQYPERFAAIAPICGGGMELLGFPQKVCTLKKVPVWAFHGAQDTVVRPEESVKMVEALKACGGNVRLTIYPEAEHDSWTQTYDNPQLYRWFLRQSRGRKLAD